MRILGTVDRKHIEEEVRRLAPWYYEFDLDGVSTRIAPACDHHGHRRVRLPNVARAILVGSTVLDVACNEGGYAFAALDLGAGHVTGFDAREVNIEKARFVAQVRGAANVEFHVASTDSWLERHPPMVDHVFLCGLLYHLPEPWRVVDEYCRLARKGVFVTSVLGGGEDGYTPFPEAEGIAASADPSRTSQMPNTSRTIVREFVRNGFLPMHIAENRTRQPGGFWGGCSLYFRRCGVELAEAARPSEGSDPVELQLVPRSDADEALDIVVYNWSEDPLEVVGELVLEDERGETLGEPRLTQFTLRPRVAEQDGSASESMFLPIRLEQARRLARVAKATVSDRGTGRVLATRRVPLSLRG